MTFQEVANQVGQFLMRLALFPVSWGVAEPGETGFDPRPRLFRYDAQRFRQMILCAEHMIRCLIIWLAYRKMRDEQITPTAYNPMPAMAGRKIPQHVPAHPQFAPRGLPLFEPKAPTFSISMPMELTCRRGAPSRSRRQGPTRRPRNDELGTHERLYLRFERLDALFGNLDQRATRLAARWSGMLAHQPEPDADAIGGLNTRPPLYGRPPPVIRPLKTYDLPPDLESGVSGDTLDTLHRLHNAAYRAAEGFTALCGCRMQDAGCSSG